MVQRSDIVQVGRLARLQLSEKEIDIIAQQIGSVLEYVHQLDQIDTSVVQPTTYILPTHNTFREDQREDGLEQEEALANAPERDGDYFKTLKILGK